MKLIWTYIKKHIVRLLLATALSSLSGGSIILIVKLFHGAIKNGLASPEMLFLKVSLLLVGFMFFGVIAHRTILHISQDTILQMRLDFCRLIFNASYEEIESKKNELFSSLVTDINSLSRILEKLPGANQNVIISFAGVGYLFFISWKLSLVLITCLLLIYLIIRKRNKAAYRLTKITRKSWDNVYHSLYDIVFGMKELTLDSAKQENYLHHYLKKSSQKEATDKINNQIHAQISGKISETILILGICTMIGSTFIMEDITSAIIAEFLTVSLFVISPISSVSNFIKELTPLKAISDHIESLGLDLGQNDLKLGKKKISETSKPIKLSEISYQYADSEDYSFRLGPVTLEIPQGMITIIYGSNGSGKTTLAKVLTGLYAVKSGHIEYGNTKVSPDTLDDYRNKISAVFADNHLFRNYKITNQNQSQIDQLLDIFEIRSKVRVDGENLLSEGLSTGQQKRLALVMSLMEEKEIYVFDEWAANQDPLFKKAFYYQLLPELKSRGKTVILVTHDDQYFHIADHKVHLVDGKVLEE